MSAIENRAGRIAGLAYGVACYAVFVATLVYLVGFVGGLWPVLGLGGPWFRSLDGAGGRTPDLGAIAIDLLLVGAFAVQHSVMARASFKRRWTRVIGPGAERSTYVLAASLCLALLFWQWRPAGGALLWDVSGRPAAALAAISAAGWGIALVATFLIDHLDLFGLRSPWLALQRRQRTAPRFGTPGLYRAVRHPLYLGFLVAFWAAPVMTLTHLVFAVSFTAYVLVGIRLEERDLVRVHGERYREYRRTTPMLLPLRWTRRHRAMAPGPGGGAGQRLPNPARTHAQR